MSYELPNSTPHTEDLLDRALPASVAAWIDLQLGARGFAKAGVRAGAARMAYVCALIEKASLEVPSFAEECAALALGQHYTPSPAEAAISNEQWVQVLQVDASCHGKN